LVEFKIAQYKFPVKNLSIVYLNFVASDKNNCRFPEEENLLEYTSLYTILAESFQCEKV
jgi:hypothetical protein